MMPIYLQSLGIAAPGLPNWETARTVLCGEVEYCYKPLQLNAPELLPAAERRRSSDSVRLALRAAAEALPCEQTKVLQPAAIFSSAYGDPVITHKLCEQLSSTPPIASPTLFHNSVHNAPAGYWSIATTNPATTTSIAAGERSFSQGLLAAIAQCHSEQRPVLLVCYDLPYPPPLDAKCPVVAPFACALLLSQEMGDILLAQIDLNLETNGVESRMQNKELESLRCGNPAAHALPLLQAIAQGGGDCHIAYNEQHFLHISVTSCN